MDVNVLSAKFKELELKRRAIEAEVSEFTCILEGNSNVGMLGPLVDAEGFPRSDIDLVAVRAARYKIICLNTDYKVLMHELEMVSSQLMALKQNAVMLPTVAAPSVSILSGGQGTRSDADQYKSPFLLVDQVTDGLPAHVAGIRIGDQITRFGSVNSSTFKKMADIATVVKETAIKASIPVTVQRISEGVLSLHQLNLIKPAGAGGLGFHIVEISD